MIAFLVIVGFEIIMWTSPSCISKRQSSNCGTGSMKPCSIKFPSFKLCNRDRLNLFAILFDSREIAAALFLIARCSLGEAGSESSSINSEKDVLLNFANGGLSGNIFLDKPHFSLAVVISVTNALFRLKALINSYQFREGVIMSFSFAHFSISFHL